MHNHYLGHCGRPPQRKSQLGFTLIELLVAVSIVAILTGLTFAGVRKATLMARQAKEIQASHTLITAYSAATADRDGTLLPGYDRTVAEVTIPGGKVLSGPSAERYPYRLAPYFQHRMDAAVLTDQNNKDIDTTSNYLISCYPAFAMNYLFVGGNFSESGVLSYPSECITHQGTSKSIIVFATAAGDSDSGKIHGYCILTPPQTTGAMWSSASWTQNAAASDYGNIDPRYDGKAICVFLNGSVRMLSIDELRDMRLWSPNAKDEDNASYTIYQAPPSRGR